MAFSSGRAVFTMSVRASDKVKLPQQGWGRALTGMHGLPRPQQESWEERALGPIPRPWATPVGLASPSAPHPPWPSGKAKAVGNGIKTRPLPLSENSLKGLLDGQPQGRQRPEAGSWPGRCVAGKWSKAGKGKQHSTLWAPDPQPVAGRKVEALVIHRSRPSQY